MSHVHTPHEALGSGPSAPEVLRRLARLREHDAPTHGGTLLSYVYDSGLAELDELAGDAAGLVRTVNGLDPTAFPSVPAMERDLIAFARRMLHGGRGVVGSITSGGTESCLLAVKTARDLWRAEDPEARANLRPRLVAPLTAHAAFQKAAHYFELDLDLVPVSPDGSVSAADIIHRLDEDVALVVVSAPSYPTAALDPIAEVAREAGARGISCHVDACIGGFALPWWPGLPKWDLRNPGVTSISADLHKFGYAPKGASVLLQRGRARQRKQFFATARWPGYPVVNATMLGSRSATGLAAAWAIVTRLGSSGYAELTGRCVRATAAIRREVDAIPGLTVLGDPTGPLLAVVADESVPAAQQVDPHRFADRISALGFRVQLQPGIDQPSGTRVPHSTHLTITPVTESVLPAFLPAMRQAADDVRGVPRANPRVALAGLRAFGLMREGARLSPGAAWAMLRVVGVGGGGDALPQEMSTLMALIEALPGPVAETLLIEVIARLSEPSST